MDFDPRTQHALQRAIEQLLRPLFRLLLRHGVSFGAFEDMAKRVYVDIARRDFGIDGKPSTASRIALLSGLTRKDVRRLLDDSAEAAPDAADRYHRASRVLSGWGRDADFVDARGKPRPLGMDGEHGFAALVRRHSGDIPPRAVLDELLRVGAVLRQADGRLELVTPAFVPQRSAVDKLGILGNDVADLIATIAHNLEHGASDPRFQRKVMYTALDAAALPAFRRLSAKRSQALLEQLDRWLAERDDGATPEVGGTPIARARVGIGIYYFEGAAAPSATTGDTP